MFFQSSTQLNRYVGQEEESPEDAAARAAYNEAQKSDWPPTRDHTDAVGAAAGGAAAGAACAALGAAVAAPLCVAIGAEIGEYLGAAIYDIVDGFFGGEVYVAPQYDYVIARRLRGSALRLAELRGSDWMTEARALEEWGVPGATLITLNDGRGAYGNQRGPWLPYYSETGLKNYLHKIASAESALASAAITEKKVRQAPGLKEPPKRGAGIGTVVIAAAGLGGAVWLASLL